MMKMNLFHKQGMRNLFIKVTWILTGVALLFVITLSSKFEHLKPAYLKPKMIEKMTMNSQRKLNMKAYGIENCQCFSYGGQLTNVSEKNVSTKNVKQRFIMSFVEYEKNLNLTLKHEKHPLRLFPLEDLVHFSSSNFQIDPPVNSTNTTGLKKILYWNDSYKRKNFGLGYGQKPFIAAECKYQNCFATSDRTKFTHSEIDAVVWHLRSSDRSIPKPRHPNAKYIFYMMESASYLYGKIQNYKRMFDYTYTYRTDSDIPFPYSIVGRKQKLNDTYLLEDFVGGKTKLAVWFISNCGGISGRMKLKKELQKYIKIDIYGKCGPLKCPRNSSNECYQMASEKYFFYLSFENSLCTDYVTEKFFNALRYNIVPVVYGAGPYWKHAPPHSYIDAFDFHSVKELTDYMIHLSKTPAEYNAYFRWKMYYLVLPDASRRKFSLCKICELLNTDKKKTNSSNRYDLYNWFVQKSHCLTSNTPIVKRFLEGKTLNSTINSCMCNNSGK